MLAVKKLRILPLAQMALAVGLICWSRALERASWQQCDMPGPDPAFLVMIAVSAPLNLARVFWDRWLPYSWSAGAWIIGVGALWYWVACSIIVWRERRELLMVRWTYGRLLIDALLVAMGALFGVMAIGESKGIFV